MTFGDLVKDLRIKQEKTLRQFCAEHNIDPSNWSKIERGVNSPPRDTDTLGEWAIALGVPEGSPVWKDFMQLADIARGEIPRDVMSNEALLKKLPVFFRTVRGAELDELEMDSFVEEIRKLYSPDKPL